MTRISSRWTLFHKWAFPAMWFGGLVFFMVTTWTSGQSTRDPMVLAVPILMAVFGVVFMRKLVWDLADEVLDGGDYLLVRKGSREERVGLANIINVSVSQMMNPPRITLRLDRPNSLGREIAFSPVMPGLSLNPFASSKVGDDLIVRVDRARVRRTAGVSGRSPGAF